MSFSLSTLKNISCFLIIGMISLSCITQQMKRRSESRTKLGTAYLQEGNPADAILTLQEATQLNPQNANAWEKLGLAYVARDAHEMAETCFKKSLRIADRAETHNNYGLLLVAMKRYDEAVSQFQKAADDLSYRRTALALTNKGRTQHLQGKYKEAIDTLNGAIKRAPNSCQARFNRGLSLIEIKEDEKALKDFENVIELCGDTVTGAYLQAAEILLKQSDKNAGCAHLQTIIFEAKESPLGKLATKRYQQECT